MFARTFYICFLLNLLLVFSVYAQGNISYLDSRYGFRELRFGSTINGNKSFVYDGAFGPQKNYIRKTDKLLVGEAKIDDIVYRTFQGKFIGVEIHTTVNNANDLLTALAELYGQPSKTIELNALSGSKAFEWNGRKARIKAVCFPNPDSPGQGIMRVSIFSIALEQEAETVRNATKYRQLEKGL